MSLPFRNIHSPMLFVGLVACFMGQQVVAQESHPWLSRILYEEGGYQNPYAERIETDRHDFTQSTKTVGTGVVQTELGYSYFYKEEGTETEHSHTSPELMVRIGLTDRLEFRTRWNYAWQSIADEQGTENISGAEDLRLSVKYELCEGEGLLPESALRLGITAPTGGSAYSNQNLGPSVDYIFTYEPVENVTLSGSAGMAINGAGEFSVAAQGGPDKGNFVAWFQSLALGVPINERSELYLEWYGVFSHGADDEFSLSFINAGIDYYLGHNVVIDFRIGKGLTGDSDDMFAGFGGGLRF